MTEDIIIQEMLVENGLGKKVVPIYFTLFHISKKIFYDEDKNLDAYSLAKTAQNNGVESSWIKNFKVDSYGVISFYVASPDKMHTRNICEAILSGFEVEYNIKEINLEGVVG